MALFMEKRGEAMVALSGLDGKLFKGKVRHEVRGTYVSFSVFGCNFKWCNWTTHSSLWPFNP